MPDTQAKRRVLRLVVAFGLLVAVPLQVLALLFLPGLFGVATILCIWSLGVILANTTSDRRTTAANYFAAACLVAAFTVVAIEVTRR